jgi:hypothetical protein
MLIHALPKLDCLTPIDADDDDEEDVMTTFIGTVRNGLRLASVV